MLIIMVCYNIKSLDKSDNWENRLIMESLEIALLGKWLNLEDGTRLTTVWLPLYLDMLKKEDIWRSKNSDFDSLH